MEESEAGLEFDEGNMCVYDITGDGELRRAAEALVHRLFKLEKAVDGVTVGVRVVKLPDGTTPLPREKPVPRPVEATKWEVFAKEKGIAKKKRDRMVWDEERQQFLPRYGYKSKKSLKEVPIMKDDPSLEPGENPFTKAKEEKRQRVKKNEKKRAENERKSLGKKAARAKPLVALEAEVGPSGKKKLPKDRFALSAKVAQRSTASVGKFDNRVGNEKEPKPVAKRRKFDSVAQSGLDAERKSSLKVAERLFLPKPEPMVPAKKTPVKKEKAKSSKKSKK